MLTGDVFELDLVGVAYCWLWIQDGNVRTFGRTDSSRLVTGALRPSEPMHPSLATFDNAVYSRDVETALEDRREYLSTRRSS